MHATRKWMLCCALLTSTWLLPSSAFVQSTPAPQERPSDDEIVSLIESYSLWRNSLVVKNGGARIADLDMQMAARDRNPSGIGVARSIEFSLHLEAAEDFAAHVRDRRAQARETLTGVNLSIEIEDIKRRGEATLDVTYDETVTFSMEVPQGVEPVLVGYSDRYAMTLELSSAGVEIGNIKWLGNPRTGSSDAPPSWPSTIPIADAAPPPLSSDVDADATVLPESVDGVSSRSAMNGSFTVEALGALDSKRKPRIVDYAVTHWSSYNVNNYKVYSNDCANFVSQALRHSWGPHSGVWSYVGAFSGKDNTANWWFDRALSNNPALWSNTLSWSVSRHLHTFSRNSGRTVSLGNLWSYVPGDFLVVDWEGDGTKDHSMIVTSRFVDRSGKLFIGLTQHTNDRLNKSLQLYLNDFPRAVWYGHST